MSVQQQIENKLTTAFNCQLLTIDNESHLHNVPANSETHFKVTLVSEAFNDQRLVARHQRIYQLLADELAGPVHALALHTYTPDEWEQHQQQAPDSPLCAK